MNKELFVDKNPSLDTSWRSIILLGRNVASYKFALAKSLLEIETSSSEVQIEKLAAPFARNICAHLKNNKKQVTSKSSKFLEACNRFNNSEITEDELKQNTIKLGFVNVIDAFHVVAREETPRFFTDNRSNNKSIILTDNFYKLKENDIYGNLKNEAESRWNLWETAISLNVKPSLLQVINDKNKNYLYVLDENKKRQNVTSSRDALNGYQKGKCFYCFKKISIKQGNENSCDVDHFFPHILKDYGVYEVDQIWNLVLTCKECNRGTGGKFEKIPDIKYLYSLNKRNNFYIESHHPLRETIINQTGKLQEGRRDFLQKMFDNAINNIPVKWLPKKIHGERL
jgi:5-methylcytosine-specific restriction endonuclease McrA